MTFERRQLGPSTLEICKLSCLSASSMSSSADISVTRSPDTIDREGRSVVNCSKTASRVNSEMLRVPRDRHKFFKASYSSTDSRNVTSLFLVENGVMASSPCSPATELWAGIRFKFRYAEAKNVLQVALSWSGKLRSRTGQHEVKRRAIWGPASVP